MSSWPGLRSPFSPPPPSAEGEEKESGGGGGGDGADSLGTMGRARRSCRPAAAQGRMTYCLAHLHLRSGVAFRVSEVKRRCKCAMCARAIGAADYISILAFPSILILVPAICSVTPNEMLLISRKQRIWTSCKRIAAKSDCCMSALRASHVETAPSAAASGAAGSVGSREDCKMLRQPR